MDTAYSTLTTIEMFLKELGNLAKEHMDAIPNSSRDVPPKNLAPPPISKSSARI